MKNKRYCLALDLIDDPDLIAEYQRYHEAGNVWPEITQSIKDAGVIDMEIYLSGNRLFAILEVNEMFSFEAKALADNANKKVQEWEALMATMQLPLPWAAKGEKWLLMDRIFTL
ncbi:L-rhamnose mutarotase [Zhongshania borealis]|jgi:L-rhamnose mutarotase|uniref:L-rhamnose mutarotase n=1 Tax=Zhongshania borealis TaxID=889488 RepID=A0ABP7X3P5_9GAMM